MNSSNNLIQQEVSLLNQQLKLQFNQSVMSNLNGMPNHGIGI